MLCISSLTIGYSTSLREGIAPLITANSSTIGLDNEELFVEFPEELRLQRKMHHIMMGATVAMTRTLHDSNSKSQPNALSPFISLFDAQFLDLTNQCRTKFGKPQPPELSPFQLLYLAYLVLDSDLCPESIYLNCYRVHLLAYYFLERSDHPNRPGLIRLYGAACALIETLSREDCQELVESCPVFIERTILMAAFAVLKIHRSPLAPHVDLAAGEAAFFASIIFNRKVSLQNDDIGARCFTIYSQLWNSKNVFRMPVSSSLVNHSNAGVVVDSLRTRIRSRLSMSIVFDCFWYWREEFAGQPSPYRDDSELANGDPAKDGP
jgi:transcriptional regulatory protein LEU3